MADDTWIVEDSSSNNDVSNNNVSNNNVSNNDVSNNNVSNNDVSNNDVSNNEPIYEYYHSTITDFTQYTNILFINNNINTSDTDINQYINNDTYPLFYHLCIERNSIVEFLNNFTNIKRIGFMFHGPSEDELFTTTPFIHYEALFTLNDLSSNQVNYSDNFLFVKGLLELYTNSIQNLDFFRM